MSSVFDCKIQNWILLLLRILDRWWYTAHELLDMREFIWFNNTNILCEKILLAIIYTFPFNFYTVHIICILISVLVNVKLNYTRSCLIRISCQNVLPQSINIFVWHHLWNPDMNALYYLSFNKIDRIFRRMFIISNLT